MINNYRGLRVWQGSMDLVEAVYRITHVFPREETFALANQMQRAAVSVPSNIAEGNARESTKEYLHHLSIAQGSLAELQTQLEIAARLGYIPSSQRESLLQQTECLFRQMYALRNALLKRTDVTNESPSPAP